MPDTSLIANTTASKTVYFNVYNLDTGASANITSVSESPAGTYTATMTGATGNYAARAFIRAGGSPALTDQAASDLYYFAWDGATITPTVTISAGGGGGVNSRIGSTGIGGRMR
jgi:hypothetical protein